MRGGLAGFGYGATTSAQQVTSGPTNCGKSRQVQHRRAVLSRFDVQRPGGLSAAEPKPVPRTGLFQHGSQRHEELPLSEMRSARLALGVQFFNLCNHPNFDKPVNDYAWLG